MAVDQSGNTITQTLNDSSVTYTINNTGANPLQITGVVSADYNDNLTGTVKNVQINGAQQTLSGDSFASPYTVNPGGAATVTLTTNEPEVLLSILPNITSNNTSSTSATASMNVTAQFSVVLASGATGSNLYSASTQPFTWATAQQTFASPTGNLVYTGTVSSIQKTVSSTGQVLSAFVKLDNGNYMTLPLFNNDIILQGTDFTNGSYINATTLLWRLTAGDRVQVTLYEANGISVDSTGTHPSSGGNTNIWKFVNVDNSEDTTKTTTVTAPTMDVMPSVVASTTDAGKVVASCSSVALPSGYAIYVANAAASTALSLTYGSAFTSTGYTNLTATAGTKASIAAIAGQYVQFVEVANATTTPTVYATYSKQLSPSDIGAGPTAAVTDTFLTSITPVAGATTGNTRLFFLASTLPTGHKVFAAAAGATAGTIGNVGDVLVTTSLTDISAGNVDLSASTTNKLITVTEVDADGKIVAAKTYDVSAAIK